MDFPVGGGWHVHLYTLGALSLGVGVVTLVCLIAIAVRSWLRAARWDFAIAVAPGRHVTVLTPGGLAILVAVMLLAGTIAVTIWLL